MKSTMAAFLGAITHISATGPIAGGVWATVQSMAMGGAAAPAAALAMPIIFSVVGVGLLAAGAACIVNEYADAQRHSMGEPTTEPTDKAQYVIVTHNYGKIEFRDFDGFDGAIDAFRGGRKLRRMLVRLNPEGEPDKDNGHGWRLPWDELAHAGWGPIWDNGMRWNLLRRIGRA